MNRQESDCADTNVWNGNFIAIDTETTGLDPVADRIIELGAVVFKNGVPTDRILSTLVNPGIPIPKEASRVNGIYDADVKDALSEKTAAGLLIDFMEENRGLQLVAHNSQFDCAFLCSLLRRAGFSENEAEARFTYHVQDQLGIDTLGYARTKLPGTSHKLGDLAALLNIENPAAHRAYGDAITCGKIFVELRSRDIRRINI